MALMARYCEEHRHAFAHSTPARKVRLGGRKVELCPVAPGASTKPCTIRSVDAIEQINTLAGHLEAEEEVSADA